MNQNLPPQGPTPFPQSLPQDCERCCGTGFWLESGRGGQRCEPHWPNSAAGCDARANAGPDRRDQDQGQGQPRQKTRRPQGFRAKKRLTALLLGSTPIKSIFFCQSLPASRLPENLTSRNFKTGSQPARRTVTSSLVSFRSRFCPARTVRADRRFSHV